MPADYSLILFIAVMALMLWWMSRSTKKMRKTAELQREEAIRIGNNVVTTAGFFGTIVDIDGDAVTLQSPSGDETVWLKRSISSVAELPLAVVEDDDLAGGEVGISSETDSPDLASHPSSDQPSDDGEINDSTRL